jgi:hypothetical protein
MKKKVRFTCVFFIFLLDGSMSCFGWQSRKLDCYLEGRPIQAPIQDRCWCW